MTEPCPFCHIDDSRILFQDELIIGLWDGYPVSPGHLLIVTRRHIADWFEATFDEQSAILRGLARGRAEILQQHAADGFNIGVNIGPAAGQTVPHLHVHLIPRVTGDVADPTGGVRHVIPGRANYLRRASGTDLSLSTTAHKRLIRGATEPFLPHIELIIEAGPATLPDSKACGKTRRR
ncbi:MAG: HIT family protein [Pirellulales bacterium]